MRGSPHCTWCEGKGWAIATRDDGRRAVEKCDTCEVIATDGVAARIAEDEEGITTSSTYPFFIVEEHPS